MNQAISTSNVEITKAKAALKKYFGYDDFRPMQAEIIQQVYQKKDALVLMPTGGGKSICYQIPAVTMEGVCIVVSPLISLMKDQVETLNSVGISAAYLNSSLSADEQRNIEEELYNNHIKLLYVSPEKLVSQSFFPLLSQANINLFAIDEAHCISSWGHDFRPEYTKMKFLKQQFSDVPVIALTATADKLTRKDITHQLQLHQPEIFISSFDRPNLSLEVRPGQKKKEQILDFVDRRPQQAGIVYCLSRKNTETVANQLVNHGLNAAFYHAGMSSDQRNRVQEAFINDQVQIVCATVAFGMGIDKSNVRWVIHYNLPKNIESYYQEIGRAGRDGAKADTMLFYSFRDVTVLRQILESEASQHLDIKLAKLDRIREYADSLICRRKILLNYFGESPEKDCGNCDVCKNPPTYFDGTVITQKALSAIARLREKVGVNMLIDVLRGSKRQEILRNGYDKIKTFGMGADISNFDWQFIMRQLLNLGYIEIAYDQHNVIKLTDSSKEVLFNGKKVELVKMGELKEKIEAKKAKQLPARSQRQRVRDELFEVLRALRLKIARKKSIPPYIVFSDKTLEEMAAERPTNDRELQEISGVGEKKLQLYGKDFLRTIVDFINDKTEAGTNVEGATQLITFQLFNRGFSIDEIAIERSMTPDIIHSHLIQLYLHDKGVNINKFINKQELGAVITAIQSLSEPTQLKEVYEYLEEKIDYTKIRFGIAYYQKNM